MKKLLFITLVLLVTNISFGQQKYETEKWKVVDLKFHLNEKVDKPLDLNFGAVIVNEKGITQTIPGFFNGDSEWIVRYCPDFEGAYTYTTYSSNPTLSGLKGDIEVTENKNPNQHGPIVISKKDKQKFSYADGTEYFLLAFELDWLFALDAENKDDIPLTKEIISHVAENNFNQIVMNVYAYDAAWGEKDKIAPEHNFSKPRVFPFGGTNDKPDFTTLNIDFFKHLDRVISHLNEKEIVSHLMIYVWNKFVSWPEPDSKEDNLYFDYVIKRYQAYPNLIWDISKEALAYGRDDMNYITRRIDRLRKLDGHGRLLSVHDYSYCANFPDKVDFISIQEWRPNIYNEMLSKLELHKNKPIFNIEHGGYEKSIYSIFDGAYTDAITCLDRNYKCIFAGTYSTYYWQNTSWYNVVFDPFSLPVENQPKFEYYKYLTRFFEKYNYSELQPNQFFFSTYGLTDNNKLFLFYVSDGVEVIQGQAKVLKSKKVSVTWFNPLTGNYLKGEDRDFGTGDWLHFPKPNEIESPIAIAILEVIE
ncbi:MAG: DUF4038 domain-containing protein [Melioribacteraceae bacterium]|nr:DUF4038 domain-containing protein [Melioribacteraceae bacterium]